MLDQMNPADFGRVKALATDSTPNRHFSLENGVSVVVTDFYVMLWTSNSNVVVMSRSGGYIVHMPPGDLNQAQQLQAANMMLDAIRGMQTQPSAPPDGSAASHPNAAANTAMMPISPAIPPPVTSFPGNAWLVLLGACISAAIGYAAMTLGTTTMSNSLVTTTQGVHTNTLRDLTQISSALIDKFKSLESETSDNKKKIQDLDDRLTNLETREQAIDRENALIEAENARIAEENNRVDTGKKCKGGVTRPSGGKKIEENKRVGGGKKLEEVKHAVEEYEETSLTEEEYEENKHPGKKYSMGSSAKPKSKLHMFKVPSAYQFDSWSMFVSFCSLIVVACFLIQCWPLTK